MTQSGADEHQRSAGAGDTNAAKPPTTAITGRREGERIGLALKGRLPCLVCGYDLQGLSVRAVCPECGTLVRATILAAVDPDAEVLAPMPTRRLTAAGLVLWSGAGLLATLLCWLPRLGDLAMYFRLPRPALLADSAALARATPIVVGLSALGALAFVRPIRSVRLTHALAAVAGALAYLPLLWALTRMRAVSTGAWPYLVGVPDSNRILFRSIVAASVCVVLIGLRPNARLLVQRSLALRTGRVDRQTILAMVGAIGLTALGDAARLLSLSTSVISREFLDDLGTMLIAVGSLLFTLGAAGALVDSIRIAKVILTPAPSLGQIVDGKPRL